MIAPATHRAFRWIPMNDNALPLPEWHDGLPGAYRWLQARLEGAAGCTEFEFHLPWIDAIRRLKQRRGAIAHCRRMPIRSRSRASGKR
jgi:hypothetical protein